MGMRDCGDEWDLGRRGEDPEAAVRLKRFLEDLLFERRLQASEAASRLNISRERLYKYLNTAAGNNNLPCYLLPIFTRMIGPELLLHLAREAGYAATRLPEEADTDPLEAARAAAAAMKDCSEVIGTFSEALADGRVSAWEYRDLHKAVTAALAALCRLEGIASAMREAAPRAAAR